MSCFSITQSFAQSWDLLIRKKTCRVAKIGNAFGGFSGGTRGEAWIACKCEADASWDRAIQHTSYSGHAREEASTRQRGLKHLCRCDYTGLVCADSRTSYQGPCELGTLYTFCRFRRKWDVQAWKPAWSLLWSVTNPAWHSFLIAEASINGPFFIAVLNYRMVHNMFMFLSGGV